VRAEDGRLEVALEANAPRSLVNDLSRKLEQWTGRRWAVIVSNAAAQPTLRAQAQAQQNALENSVQADPRVQDVMAKWPGAKLETVRRAPQAQADEDASEPPVEDED
jgi:DNA polymerase-3 subunit gamma/tau